ncbi:hypothetical protein AYI68_g7589 [Smittium mucronatum]|uniref:Uncharacterized protein n=1 Tax=Smittium mucronatum TaxID=133383 RepID=A0A1R0GN94_9FUNG|nr:hypothetical protein AYI68_g7589 [Smittium mucronatum]
MDTTKNQHRFSQAEIKVDLTGVSNSLGSRFNKNAMGKMIDYIFYYNTGSIPNRSTSNKCVKIFDHFPIAAEWGRDTIFTTIQKRKINLRKI